MDKCNKDFVKLHVEYDAKKPGFGVCEVKGSEVAIISAIGTYVVLLKKGLMSNV